MKQKEIVLTPEELEEIKDDIRFREKVMLALKQLNGIPKAVWTLGVSGAFQWAIILAVIVTLFNAIANGK